VTTTPIPTRSNPLIPAFIGFALVIVLATGVAVAAYVGFRLFQRGTEIPSMLDSSTHAYITFTPNLKDVPNIERLSQAFPELIGEGDEGYTASLDEFLTDTLDMSFDEDIASWVGTEVGVAFTFDEAFLDGFGDLANGADTPSFDEATEIGEAYWIIQSRDDAKLNEFLTNFNTKLEEDGGTLSTTEHNGVTIYEVDTSDSEFGAAAGIEIAYAVIKSHLVVTNQPEGLPLMVDRQEQDSLAALPAFQRIKDNVPDSAIAYAFYNGAFYKEFWASFTESMPAGANVPGLQLAQESIDALEAGGITLTVEETGLRFEAITAMDVASLSEEARQQLETTQAPVGTDLLSLVGDEALFTANSRLPQEFGEQMMEGFSMTPEAVEAIEAFEADTGINVEADLLSWLVGDLVVTLLPGTDEVLPMSGYLRLRSENPDAAKAGIDKLIEALLQGSPESPFETQMIEGVEWMVLPDPYGTDAPYAGYAFVENDVIVALGSPAINETGERGNALIESDTYRAATQGLPENNTGVFYLNIQDTVTLVDDLSPGMVEEEMKTRLAPFVAVAGAREAGLPEDGLMRVEFFIYIAAPVTE
jgi:hypothetical protein